MSEKIRKKVAGKGIKNLEEKQKANEKQAEIKGENE